ncbi:MAG: hypothetical protein ABIE36_01210 [Candidatus Diapherotrites archaeon]
MVLTVYEELYQPPLEICLVLPFCIKDYERTIILIGKYLNPTKNNYNNHNNLPNNSPNNHLPKAYLLKNHQNRTVVNKMTNISLQGLEMRARNQEAKRIRLGNDMLISASLKKPVQSRRSQKHRKKDKYSRYYPQKDILIK